MEVVLRNSDLMEIESLSDLKSLIPKQRVGEPLNYGQGEGQFRVNRSVWGIYSNDDREYYFVLEEGMLDLGEATMIAQEILQSIRERWGNSIAGVIIGSHHSDPQMRLIPDL